MQEKIVCGNGKGLRKGVSLMVWFGTTKLPKEGVVEEIVSKRTQTIKILNVHLIHGTKK